MMLIDGAPRLSLTSQRRRRGFKVSGKNNNSKTSSKNKTRRKRKAKKRVCFDMVNKTCVVKTPKARKEDHEHLWHSNIDYGFFALNWKYYPHEPMAPRSFL